MDWGEIVACHAGYYKFSHKHIKPTHTGNLLIDAHNMTHLSGFLIFPNSDRTPLCFHRPTHPTETTLGVLFKHFWGNMLSALRHNHPPPPPTRKKNKATFDAATFLPRVRTPSKSYATSLQAFNLRLH